MSFIDQQLPFEQSWCSKKSWQDAFKHLGQWHWLGATLPQALSLEGLHQVHPDMAKALCVVEHPWQVRWLQSQWEMWAHQGMTVPRVLPKVVTLNGWVNEILSVQYPQAMTQSSAALTVWRALEGLKSEGDSPIAGRWALAQQMVALLAQIDTLQGIKPEILERLQTSNVPWLSRESQWLDAIRRSLPQDTTWALHKLVLSELAKQDVLMVMPAAHPSLTMQAFLNVLDPAVQVCVPDPSPSPTTQAELTVWQCNDFEHEAQFCAQWVVDQLQTHPLVGIVAHNRALARRLSALLARQSIVVDDRVGWALSTTVVASCVKGVLDVVVDEDVLALMQWLSLPMVQHGWPAAKGLEVFLNDVWLRQQVVAQGGVFLRRALQQAQVPEHRALLQTVLTWQHQFAKQQPIAAHATLLVQVLEPIRNALQQDPAGVIVWRSIETLLLEPNLEKVPFSVFARLLQSVFESERFAPAIPDARVQFLPMHEAGWTQVDALLMLGCNELHFPAKTPALAPLLASVRRELGVPAPQPERATWNHVVGAHALITVTFSAFEQAHAARISPWLSDQTVVMAAAQTLAETTLNNTTVDVNPSEKNQNYKSEDNKSEDNKKLASKDASTSTDENALEPCGVDDELGLLGLPLPSAMSVTQLAVLGQCPYKFMLKSALGLQLQSQPAYWPSQREKGNLLHAALHRAVSTRAGELKRQLLSALDELAQELGTISGRYVAMVQDAKRMVPVFLAEHEARERNGWHVYATEEKLSQPMFFEGVELHGKADRIDVNRRGQTVAYGLIDYKTSSEAYLKQKVSDPLSDAQLVLYIALMRSLGLDVTQAFYWRLHDKPGQKSMVELMLLDEQLTHVMTLFTQAWQGLTSGAPALALPSVAACTYCDFAGICRKSSDVQQQADDIDTNADFTGGAI